jgi:transketolase
MAADNQAGPSILALTRQNTVVFPKEDPDWRNTIRTGAYIAKSGDPAGKPDLILIATGSEVGTALEAAKLAEEKSGKKIRVVSMISRELFESQSEAIRNTIVPGGIRTICCEAGVKLGWERWAKPEDIFCLNRFGESGPGPKVAEYLGITPQALLALIEC